MSASQPSKKSSVKSLLLCLTAAIVISLFHTYGNLDARILPFGDSSGFYKRALTTYGLFHSGQLADAFQLLIEPSKNLFPSTVLFLLLPPSMADSAGYGLITILSWHIFTALGLWVFLKTFNREQFVIPVLLLVSANNHAFDPTYQFYMDFPFMSLSLLSVSFAVSALKKMTPKSMMIAGAIATLPFFAKPPNALINTVLIGLFMAGVLLTNTITSKQKGGWITLFKQAGFCAAGFLPLFALACVFGTLESIVDTIYLNESAGIFNTTLVETGLKRTFYFPLCLSFYYNIFLLAGFFIILSAFRFVPQCKRFSLKETDRILKNNQPIFIWLVAVFLLFWGCHFSFILKNKLIRSLPLMLPIIWSLIFLCTPFRKLKLRIIIPACCLLFLIPFTQAKQGFVKNKQNRNPEYYSLTGDWLTRLPAQYPDLAGSSQITHNLKTLLEQSGLHQGKVMVGTQMISWNSDSLDTLCNSPTRRNGKTPDYAFTMFMPGNYKIPVRHSLENANGMLLILEPRVQYNRLLYKTSVDLTNYAFQQWKGKVADVNVTYNQLKQPAVCVIRFYKPMSDAILNQLAEDLYAGTFSDVAKKSSRFSDLPLQEKIKYVLNKEND